MARDIRKMMQEPPKEFQKLPKGHEARFEARLNKVFSPGDRTAEKKRDTFFFLRVAAMIVVVLSAGYLGYQKLTEETTNALVETPVKPDENVNENVAQITLGDISPDLKKVEEFYLTGINVQMASLQTTDENKEIVTGYMQRLAELDAEYSRLNKELNEVGPTEASITALIDNLKLRLDLLFKLKNKLKELKNQNNEQLNSIEA
ncbi:hypothetical protein ATE92_0287 [Ulvibacter sp. MAR_2010_11]|uniref:hypothetical protein n=1 Tax=Ulvibacter sp. MAR_2010_11 TaxID=1250229 RepID=UPI000C2C4FFF|nr:hypothetical protein [Ulvibacter sp. MAR_2010_11]PKA82162.1 hypothetical protein ATE92_0287 [Ulvibacter sp. MAR_2010_11]